METLNRIEQSFRRLSAQGKKIVRLYSANPVEMGFQFPGDILERVYGAYFKTQDYAPHPKGLPQARQTIHDYYEKQGVFVDSENIILSSGTSESFFYLFSLLCKP